MKIEQAHIDQIRKQFAELQSKEDLVKLLSDAKNMLYGEECKPFQLKSLTYYANPTLCKKRYQTFTIKKKSGADRTINAPVKGLKSILRSLNFVLQCVYEPHEAATGFVLEKSIVDNAKKHVGHHYVLNIDLKDFFHTFDRNRVKMGFMFEPFNLNGDKEPLAFLLASLCTHPFEIDGEEKTVLPQGSPTSPTLTNILCKKLDRRLTGLANRFGATYTRYADDITFSSPHNIYTDEEFKNELKRIIEEDQKLVINPKKTRLQKAGYRQEATGLIVNDKVNVRRRYVKQIRMWLYYWEKYGYEKAQQIFILDYTTDKGHVKKGKPNLANVLDGKLEFLKMVKGENDSTYETLKKRFDKLYVIENSFSKVLDIWENEGILKNTDKNTGQKTSEHIIHNPKHITKFLRQFKENTDLKWTTHSWDNIKYASIDDFINALNENKKEFNRLYKHNRDLYNLIQYFIYQPKSNPIENGIPKYGWVNLQAMKFGWQFPDNKFLLWCKENYDNKSYDERKKPFQYLLPKELRPSKTVKGKEIKYFQDVVEIFKTEIQFREEYLYKEIRKRIHRISDFNFSGLDELKKLDFYTYTPGVLSAIDHIFEQIKRNETAIDINISYIIHNQKIILSITQINSFPSKELDINNTKSFLGGHLNAIAESLFSLADFSIESNFKYNGKIIPGELQITYENMIGKRVASNITLTQEPIFIESNNKLPGFTYKLTFYI